MHYVRLRSVIWVFYIPQVLGRAEYLKCKSVEELSLTEYAVSWLNAEPRPALKVRIDIFELRDSIGDSQLFVEVPTLPKEALAHRVLVECVELLVDIPPK